MPFCTKCGTSVTEESKFCPNCGKPIAYAFSKQETIRSSSKPKKCPYCGGPVTSFYIHCRYCGHKLSDAVANETVKEFSDAMREDIKRSFIGTNKQNKSSLLSSGIEMYNHLYGSLSSGDLKKIDTIITFPIPNDREEIYEFLIMAVSNINPSAFSLTYKTMYDYNLDKKRCTAWISKYQQASQKAALLYGDSDPALKRADKLFEDKMSQIKKNKKIAFMIPFLAITLSFSFLIGMIAFALAQEKRGLHNKELDKLYTLQTEIESDILNQNYDDALEKAPKLRGGSSLSESERRKWDEIRENYIEQIQQLKK